MAWRRPESSTGIPDSRILLYPTPWIFPGGVGFFFDDLPLGEGLESEKWLERLIYFYEGRFGADAAFPSVALNLAHRRRYSEKSSWFLKSRVEGPPP